MAQNGRIAVDARSAEMLGVIGGSGFYTFFGTDARTISLDTPYGAPSAPITVGTVGAHEVAFLPRHGVKHEYSPHTVPYRANMWALRALAATSAAPRCRSAPSSRDGRRARPEAATAGRGPALGVSPF